MGRKSKQIKIVQSFWSKPLNKPKDFDGELSITNRKKGGWLNEKIYFMSCALSCLKLRQFYDNVELVTDSFGKKLLIDDLGLPYSNVRVELDKISDYSEELWAIGKLFAYKLQEEPFIHVDNDVFIWKRFDTKTISSKLITQGYEFNAENYDGFCKSIYHNFSGFTKEIDAYTKNGGKFDANVDEVPYNFGVFGGNDVNFIKYYVDFVLEFLAKNLNNIHKLKNTGALSVYLEEGIFYCLSKFKGVSVHQIFPGKTFTDFTDFTQFENIPLKWYLHALSKGKRVPTINEQVYLNLLNEFPDFHKIIMERF